MRCYVKDRYTFITSGVYEVSEYDIFLNSIFDDKSKISIMTDNNISEGGIAYCDNGWLGVIEKVAPEKRKKKTTLTCGDILNLFNDDFSGLIEYAPCQELTPRGFIYNGYYNPSLDTYPHYSYLEFPWPTTATPGVSQYSLYAKKGLINGRELIYGFLRTFNIFTVCSYLRKTTGDFLKVEVTHQDSTTRKIDFSDNGYSLIKETYSADSIGMVNCCVWDESTQTLTETAWYLKSDGTVTKIMPDPIEVYGARKTLYVGAKDDQEQKALDEISKVKYSHRIEFSSQRQMNFYDLLELRINGRVLNSYISSVRIKSDSNRFFYTSGEMRTKLTDKIKELI